VKKKQHNFLYNQQRHWEFTTGLRSVPKEWFSVQFKFKSKPSSSHPVQLMSRPTPLHYFQLFQNLPNFKTNYYLSYYQLHRILTTSNITF